MRANGSEAGGPAGQLGRAFADPILDAQRAFRLILTALSEPGTVQHLDADVMAPAALHAASAQLLLCLADHETPIWLAPSIGADAAAWLRFHCGARIVEEPKVAQFAVLDGGNADLSLASFNAGDERYPDKSATVIVQVASLEDGPPVSATGPGIRDAVTLAPAGVHGGFWDEVAANHASYPMGVDIVLVAGRSIIGLPRSTRVAIGENR